MLTKTMITILTALSSCTLFGCQNIQQNQPSNIKTFYTAPPHLQKYACKNARVIIIGAGVSGIETANYLYTHGIHNLTILEARDRTGGRIDTVRTNNVPVDLGAAWIHGAAEQPNPEYQNPLIALAKKYKLYAKTFDLDSSHSIFARYKTNNDHRYSKLNETQLDGIVNQYYRANEYLDNNLPTRIKTVGNALRYYFTQNKISATEQSNLLFMSNLYIEFQYANDIDLLPLNFDDSDGFPGHDKLILNGYDTLINGLAKQFRDHIKLNSPVTKIDYTDPQNIVVTTQGNHRYNAQYVICTVPLGVLKHHDIQFTPKLPKDKERAITQDLQMNVLDKAVLVFPRVFWDNTQFIGSIPNAYLNPKTNQWVNKNNWPAFVNLNYYIHQPILVAYSSGKFALQMEKKTNQQITQNIMDILRKTYGDNIPKPSKVIITRWKEDKYSRGAYTSLTTHSLPNNADFTILQRPEANGHLVFAGEGTNASYSTTVHGAYLSGIRAGNQVYWAMTHRNAKERSRHV